MDLPAEHVLDHYRHPRRKIPLAAPTVTHEERNWSCGDALTLQLRIEDDCIAEIGWSGEGCAVSQAAMSLLAETLPGMDTGAARQLEPPDILALLRIPVGTRRMKCALLCLHTLKNALRAHGGEPLQGWEETVGNADRSS